MVGQNYTNFYENFAPRSDQPEKSGWFFVGDAPMHQLESLAVA
jgi:hypothetical protein